MFYSPHLERSKTLDFLGQRDQQFLVFVSSDVCSCNALVMQPPLSNSMTLEDGIDWAEEGLGGLGITVLHRDPGGGGNTS